MSRVPGTFAGNGSSPGWIPPDLVWDEDNHPIIFPCSQHTEHHPNCDGNCGEPTELDSESQVELLNEGRKYARIGMSFFGVPAAYNGVIPVRGIAVELVDLLMWLQAAKEVIMEKLDFSEFEFEELYRTKKLEFLRNIREANEENIKRARTEQMMAVAKKPLLGPDGNPLL